MYVFSKAHWCVHMCTLVHAVRIIHIVCIQVISVDVDKREKLVDVDSPKKRTSYTDNSTGGIAVLDVTQIMLTSVSGYDGDPNLDYFCLQVISCSKLLVT